MNSLDFSLNRPVHMARRDAFFERAMDLLNAPTQDLDTEARLKYTGRVLALLKTAEHHGNFIVKWRQASQQEKDFQHFLQLISHNVQSAQSMLQHQSHFESEEGFLFQFLGARPDDGVLPAMHYRRRADDIFQGLWHILRLAHGPYRKLQQESQASLDAGESERYGRAYEATKSEMDSSK
jgi:hypothetical protein